MKQGGFTLLETVIGLLILVIGTMAFSTMIMSGASIQKESLRMTKESDQSLSVKAEGNYVTTSTAPLQIQFGGAGGWELTLNGNNRVETTSATEAIQYTYFETTGVTLTSP